MKTLNKRPNYFMRPKRDRRTALEKMRVKLCGLALTGRILATADYREFEFSHIGDGKTR